MDALTWSRSAGLVTLAARATLVLGAALLLAWSLRRTAAGTRHLLWTATFAFLLALPIATAWLPAWELPLLPAEAREAATAGAGTPARVVVMPAERVSRSAAGATAPRTVVVPDTPEWTDDTRAAGPLTGPLSGPLPVALLLWALGSAAAMASVTIGTLRFRSIVRSAEPIEHPVWLRQVARLRVRLGIDADVRLLESDAVETPMTGGWRRPVVVLPRSARAWTPERRQVVLLHEMIHVRRHDALRQLLGQAALALYWFHPLTWVASRLAAMSREQACDEAVLELGTRPSEYAGHLLALAEGMHAAPALVSLPMVQPSQLERRIMAILAPRRPRASAVVTAVVLFLLGGLGLSAAVARPVPATPSPFVAASGPTTAADVASVGLGADTGSGISSSAYRTAPGTARTAVASAAASTAGVADRVSLVVPGRAAQEAPTCRAEGLHGNFDGTLSIHEDGDRTRYEQVGWANGDRIIQRYVDDLRLCMRTHGDVVMTDDRTDVRAVGRGGWLVLESEEAGLQRLVITEEAGGIRYAWSVDGHERAFDDDARAWRDGMFRVLQAYWDATRLRGQESTLRGRISSRRGHISSLQGRISSHRGHISSLNGRISSLRGHVSSLQGKISSLNGHVSSLNGRISSYRGHISSLRSAMGATANPDTRARLEDEVGEYEARIRGVENEIDEFDLDSRVADVRAEIDAFDLEGQVRRVEQEIADYDLDGKVRALEQEIADYDLDGKVRALEQEIEDLDADRRAEEIERGAAPDLAALRRLIDRL